MRSFLFAFCVLSCFSMPLWAESIGNVSGAARTCAGCTGVFSSDLQFEPSAYRDSNIVGTFNTLDRHILAAKGSIRLDDGFDFFEHGKFQGKLHGKLHGKLKDK